VANDGIHGRELWRSDGTEEGTYLVKDILLGEGSSEPAMLTSASGRLYFVARDGVHGE
jgi:ELWxxDGT repeat protein